MQNERITYSEGGRRVHHHETEEVLAHYLRPALAADGAIRLDKFRDAAYHLGLEDGWSDGDLPAFFAPFDGKDIYCHLLKRSVRLWEEWAECWREGQNEREGYRVEAKMEAERELQTYGTVNGRCEDAPCCGCCD